MRIIVIEKEKERPLPRAFRQPREGVLVDHGRGFPRSLFPGRETHRVAQKSDYRFSQAGAADDLEERDGLVLMEILVPSEAPIKPIP
jgi:hypothetical protein